MFTPCSQLAVTLIMRFWRVLPTPKESIEMLRPDFSKQNPTQQQQPSSRPNLANSLQNIYQASIENRGGKGLRVSLKASRTHSNLPKMNPST